MIIFKNITRDNFWDCIGLSVEKEQEDFVTTNAVSIAQSKVQPECIPLAIYDDLGCLFGLPNYNMGCSYDKIKATKNKIIE